MAQKQPGQDGPSLELPSLGFGRKRKRKRSTQDETSAPTEERAPDTAGTPEPPAPEVAEAPGPDPDAAPTPDDSDTRTLAPEPVEDPAPAPTREPDPDPQPAPPPLFADEVAADPPTARDETTEATTVAPEKRKRRAVRLPTIAAMPASMLTGAVVGALLVGLTWGALRLCELVQGTSSCGNPGFFLLLAIAVAMVVLGKVLLAAFGVPEPGSTSFLGVGLVVVIALLFLVDLLFHWWMILVIPGVAVVAYALSHWVTTAFVDVPGDDLHR